MDGATTDDCVRLKNVWFRWECGRKSLPEKTKVVSYEKKKIPTVLRNRSSCSKLSVCIEGEAVSVECRLDGSELVYTDGFIAEVRPKYHVFLLVAQSRDVDIRCKIYKQFEVNSDNFADLPYL